MRPWIAFCAACLFAIGARAENDTDTLMKNTAIAGAIASWAAAAWLGDDVAAAALHAGGRQHLGLAGGSASQTDMAQMLYGWDFSHNLIERPTWRLRGQWEVDLTGWWANKSSRRNNSGWMTGITPVLQFEHRSTYRPYAEFGIGLKYLSDILVGDQYKSTQLQFGDLVGAGISIDNWQLGFRFLHISNGGIETPNPGTNYYGIKLDYAF
ncbi:lipid A 3-O-deacylase [Sulfurivirga caldicuralii]|uniref:Lipid A 3-O-deacylase n=1 Tax=Sulfurivirga caldicuralii TaxID=364032 RepID=A0A1N6DQS7_9GAMM|nr:acyloxyacyl hydrolase [Sulfurivirga caldicuralii]SIN73014.1 lipid A 3-O-deacylase [Sulfurivirga caldicuralii]